VLVQLVASFAAVMIIDFFGATAVSAAIEQGNAPVLAAVVVVAVSTISISVDDADVLVIVAVLAFVALVVVDVTKIIAVMTSY
jgi:hypothetical protein